MTESKLFISSCTRREWGRRRSISSRKAMFTARYGPTLTTLVFLVVGFAAFWAGRFGI
jgi:tetrahydromethanopterin S-methyltransferase subunit E